jgi:hypothetical protein
MCGEGTVLVDELTVPLIGSVDIFGVGPGGELTLVECKLESNPEIHRKIVGQIFAYAAGLWRMSYEELDRHFSERGERVSLADAAKSALPDAVKATWQEEAFRSSVAENLKAGRFTLVIAVDRLTDELKAVVPYVNSHTVATVRFLALEIGYLKDGDLEIVLPVSYGEESANVKPGSRRNVWTSEDYFEKLSTYADAIERAVNDLVAFSLKNGAQIVGGTGSQPSLNVQFQFGGEARTVWSSYYYAFGPTFDLNFEYLRGAVPVDAMAESARIMRSLEGAEKRYAGLNAEFRSRPSLTVDGVLTKPGAVEQAERALTFLLRGTQTENR